MTVTWPSPQYPFGGFLGTACRCDFRGFTFQVDLTSWLDKLSLVKWFEEGPEARVTNQLDKRNLSSWLVKFHLCSNASVTPVGPIFGPLSTRLIEGFHFEDCLISRFYFVPNPSNLVSQVLLCARSFQTLNRGISFRRIQILLVFFGKETVKRFLQIL